MFYGLLETEQREVDAYERMPYFFEDLNLDMILSKLKLRSRNHEIQSFYYRYPRDYSTTRYRQAIFTEMKEKQLKVHFISFAESMSQTKEYLARMEKAGYEPQKQLLFFNALHIYLHAVLLLRDQLTESAVSSEGLVALVGFLTEHSKSGTFQSARKEADSLQTELSQMKFNLILKDHTLKLVKAETAAYYGKQLKKLFPKQFISQDEETEEPREETAEEIAEYYFKSPFATRETLCNLEITIAEAYKRFAPEFFTRIAAFFDTYQGLMEERCFEVDQEAWFYLAYLDIIREMEQHGFAFCTPHTPEDGRLSVTDGFDIALAWKNMSEGKEVIRNSIDYREGERFFVLTGPNQGGKTTFARSLGQLVYFAMMGLDVPGREATVPFYEGLQTHFSVEESMETGRGKLKEELIRLHPMMMDVRRKQFVILNELFTTAATYDAYQMGDRVVKHFIERGCTGIYVTHIPELAAGSEGVVSLVALADAADHRRRTFVVARMPAQRTGYAGDIVEKHRLTYEDVKQRVASRLGGDRA